MSALSLPARRRRIRLPRAVAADWGGRIGAVLLAFILLVAILGPLFAPHDTTTPIGIPGAGPSSSAPFGLDFLGRDVLSRVLSGGRSTLLLGGAATALTYLVGITVGLVAGYARSIADPLLMRTVDVFLSFPALLVMLLFVTAFGGGPGVLVGAAAIVLFPGVARIVRTATLEASTRGYVEAAVARGERTANVLRREILPNIAPSIVADLGIRFSWSIILIASVNYLGLGLRPPTADWGLMVSENREIVSTNPLSLLAPAAILALLIIAVNLVGDAYVRQRARSGDLT
ncbi:MAG TPA: ABC transporter permease [Solirubrobacteraceae bacterium]|nr:ABC transporter permease [Solirubrobacteraceae bacterium]